MTFIDSFIAFLDATAIPYKGDGRSFCFDCKDIIIRAVPLGEEIQIDDSLHSHPGKETIFLYEDRWFREGDLLKRRLLAHLGSFRSVFARKCEVRSIAPQDASQFLTRYHSYGNTRSKYKYGMFCGGDLIAVSTFSAPRKMKRLVGGEIVDLDSYEWVRYASLPDCRISGGMGKMLQKFVEDVHPQEVMSYADREWSEGKAYMKLGFERVETKPPIDFYVDTTNWSRISAKKIANDKAYQGLDTSQPRYVKIHNLGSVKYLKILQSPLSSETNLRQTPSLSQGLR